MSREDVKKELLREVPFTKLDHLEVTNVGEAVVQVINDISGEAVLTESAVQEGLSKVSVEALYECFDPKDRSFLEANEPCEFVFPLSRAGRFWIYAVILLSPEESRGERRLKMTEIFGCSLSRIGAVTAYLTGRLREKASGSRLEDILKIEKYVNGKTMKVEMVSSSDSERGDTFEYDNPVKNKWRQHCLQYIDDHTDPTRRHSMKVLCLPGRHGWEIPEYLRLGFKAENIVGVERSQRVEREFQAMADRYGIQAHIGRVEDLVGSVREPFDVANLDFTSPVDASVSKVFSNILISDSFVGLVNVLGRRDGRFSKEQLALFSARGQLTEKHMEGVPYSSKERLSFMRQFQDPRDSTSYTLTNARREALPFLVSEFFGVQRPESWTFPDLVDRFIRKTGGECSPGIVSANLEAAFAGIADSLASVYSDTYPPGSRSSLGRVSFQLADFLSGGALMIAEGHSQTIDLAHLRYKSPPCSTPFHTILFKKQRPVSIYDSYRDVGLFFVNSALDTFGLRDGQEADLYLSRRRGKRFLNTDGRKVDFSRLSFVYDSPTGVKCQLKLKRCDGFKRAIMSHVKESVTSMSDIEVPVQEL